MSDDQHKYTLLITDEGDGLLWGEVQELPGCFASGSDMDELMEAAAEAIVMYQAPETPEIEASAEVVELAHRRAHSRRPRVPHVREYAVPSAQICIEA